MVHRADGAGEVALVGSSLRGGHAGHRGRRLREPEEGQEVAAPAVEEEVLPHPGGELDGLDEGHAEHALVELHRARHVARHEREVVDAAELELPGHGYRG